MLRNAEFTRPETVRAAAHPCRGPGGQGGNEHGGSPWFKEAVEPGRAPTGEGRELLTPWGDERVRSLSHRGAVSFKSTLSSFLGTTPAVGEALQSPTPPAENWLCFPARSRLVRRKSQYVND